MLKWANINYNKKRGARRGREKKKTNKILEVHFFIMILLVQLEIYR